MKKGTKKNEISFYFQIQAKMKSKSHSDGAAMTR